MVLTIGSTPGGILASAILGESGVMYDLDKFIFLGSTESESHYSFLTRREAGWDSLEKLRSATGVRIGSTPWAIRFTSRDVSLPTFLA